jgi:hypothetical protein
VAHPSTCRRTCSNWRGGTFHCLYIDRERQVLWELSKSYFRMGVAFSYAFFFMFYTIPCLWCSYTKSIFEKRLALRRSYWFLSNYFLFHSIKYSLKKVQRCALQRWNAAAVLWTVFNVLAEVPILPSRWKQQIPSDDSNHLPDYTASHFRTSQCCTAVRTSDFANRSYSSQCEPHFVPTINTSCKWICFWKERQHI